MEKLNSENIIKILQNYKSEDDILAIIFRSCLLAKNELANVKRNIFGVKSTKSERLFGDEFRSIKSKTAINSQSVEITEKKSSSKIYTVIKIKGDVLNFSKVEKFSNSVTKIEADLTINPDSNYIRFDEVMLENYHKNEKGLKARNKALMVKRTQLIEKKNALI